MAAVTTGGATFSALGVAVLLFMTSSLSTVACLPAPLGLHSGEKGHKIENRGPAASQASRSRRRSYVTVGYDDFSDPSRESLPPYGIMYPLPQSSQCHLVPAE